LCCLTSLRCFAVRSARVEYPPTGVGSVNTISLHTGQWLIVKFERRRLVLAEMCGISVDGVAA